MRNYRKLVVWSRAKDLTVSIYELTRSFPRDERFGLTAQARRAAISIVSNIAEGAARRSDKEFARYLDIALVSVAELQAQLDVALALGFSTEATNEGPAKQVIEVKKMLSGLLVAVTKRLPSQN